MLKIAGVLLIAALAVFFLVSTPASKEVVPGAADTIGLPFSSGILSGDVLYVSGTIGNVPGTTRVDGGIEEQTRNTFQNIEAVLKSAGMSFDDVVSSNVYLVDSRHFAQMNEVYREHFKNAPPARATVANDMVIPGALVEISMIAVKGEKKVVQPEGWSTPASPYSWGVMAGDTLYIAGMVSEDPAAGKIVQGDIAVQTKQTLQNVDAVLKAAGMDAGEVAACRVYLDDARDFQAMNEVYGAYFVTAPPVRATTRAQLVIPGLKIEIQCTAVKDDDRRVIGGSPANRPYSRGIQTQDRLYLAGMVGRGPDGFAPGDAAAQTRQALANLEAVLLEAGLGFKDVIDATVWVSDVRYYQAMNSVYSEVVPAPFPARATVGAQLMGPDALVEIMMTAERKR